MTAQKYRRKPELIEARQVTPDDIFTVASWCGGRVMFDDDGVESNGVLVPTPTGESTARIGDWIARRVIDNKVDCWPIAEDIFKRTYEPGTDVDLADPRLELLEELGTALGIAPYARPETPASVWKEYLKKVEVLRLGYDPDEIPF